MAKAKRSSVRLVQAAVIFAAALAIVFAFWREQSGKREAPSAKQDNPAHSEATLPGSHEDHSADGSGGTLLQQMDSAQSRESGDLSGPVPTNEQLEKQFAIISQSQRQVNELKARATSAAAARNVDLVNQIVAEGKPIVSLLNLRLAAFERDLDAARRTRPQDATVQWLTGELLLAVGGEPEEILPYFSRATAAGLKRAELYGSLAKIEFDLNHFQAAYDDALKALDGDNKSRTNWETYVRASFALERFSEVIQRLDETFPGSGPDWVEAIRRDGRRSLESWTRETALRKAEDKAGNLPLVRFVIEHRKFVNPTDGQQLASVKNTGRGEVVFELFEDDAPATVANFISLAESGFYNGTSFFWAEAGHMVVGGDPNTKNDDPADDGSGSPGYVIPDEFDSPRARAHFRGTISTVQNGPRRAGSQFLISLTPSPEFDGRSTVFGRVIRGQEVIDQITEGRTNRAVGQFGKIIPGDQLVSVEIIRKRPHPYRATQLRP